MHLFLFSLKIKTYFIQEEDHVCRKQKDSSFLTNLESVLIRIQLPK